MINVKYRQQKCKRSIKENTLHVLVFGPALSGSKKGYGGGKGGVVSAISRMLRYFEVSNIAYSYCGYSVRSYSRYWFFLLPFRMLKDLFIFVNGLLHSDITVVHLVASGGVGVYRSCMAAVATKISGKRLVVDVRGNGLDGYVKQNSSFFYKLGWKIILKCANRVLIQRPKLVSALFARYGLKIQYHPNWIQIDSVPERVTKILLSKQIKVVFVGYCYPGKGVFEIVDGCEEACRRGLSIDLTLIGKEEASVAKYLDEFIASPELAIHRLGTQDKDTVWNVLLKSDVFLFPTYHAGEGHPNVINEAMAFELAIVTSQAGAIGEILDSTSAYFVMAKVKKDIANRLIEIDQNRDAARTKGRNAYKKMLGNFNEEKVLANLVHIYNSIS